MTRALVIGAALAAAVSVASAQPAKPAKPAKAKAEAATDNDNKAKATDQARKREFIVVDRVVAVVNDAIILESELRRRSEPMAAELDSITDTRERARRAKLIDSQILDDMINEELLSQAAREAQLEVSEEEVDAALVEIKRQNEVDDEGLDKALRAQGYTMSAYRQDIARQILRMRAVNVLVRPRVNVTDDDVRAAYEERGRRAGAVTSVRLFHILLALPERPTEAQLTDAKRRAGELVSRARAGEDFTELAKEFSDDGATSVDGGDLGWFERGSLPTEWEVVIFVMDKGEVRGPVSGPRGLHVFHVADQKKSEQKPFDEVKDELRDEIYRREMDKETRTWIQEQREKAHIELKL